MGNFYACILTAIFTGVGSGVLIRTLYSQMKASDFVQKSAFDTVFFTLFNQYKKEISSLTLKRKWRSSLKGTEVIDFLAKISGYNYAVYETEATKFGWYEKSDGEVSREGFLKPEYINEFRRVSDSVKLEQAANVLFSIFHKILNSEMPDYMKEYKNMLKSLLSPEERYVFGNYRYIKYKLFEENPPKNVADEVLCSNEN